VVLGRDRELSLLRGFLAAATSSPQSFIVEREPGIGKTAIGDAAWTSDRLAIGVRNGRRLATPTVLGASGTSFTVRR
jgi:hypothetical protein